MPLGNDANPGIMYIGSSSVPVPKPYATIQHALSVASDGDVILLLPGSFSDSGNCGLTLTASTVDAPIIGGPAASDAGLAFAHIQCSSGHFATVSGGNITVLCLHGVACWCCCGLTVATCGIVA